MSKYIPQINNTNFVYPNYDLAEYDVEIVHNINNNNVFGLVNSFSATTVTSTGITISFNATWIKNGAEIFLRQNGNISYLSVHAFPANRLYYKPFRVVSSISTTNSGQTTITSGNTTFTITPSQFGLSSFVTGPYYFEVRFIGGNSIYPVCQTLNITI
jgi:hypothetical protein